MRRFVGVLVIASALAATPVAVAGTPSRGSQGETSVVDVDIYPARAGRPVELQLHATYGNLNGERARPQRSAELLVERGFKFYGRYFPTCDPAALQANGRSACPPRSRIGNGFAAVDLRPQSEAPVTSDLTIYNGPIRNGNRTIVIYGETQFGSAAVPLELRRLSSGPYGYELVTNDLPRVPGVDPVVNQLDLRVFRRFAARRVGGRRVFTPLLRAPRRCVTRWAFAIENLLDPAETLRATDSTGCGS